MSYSYSFFNDYSEGAHPEILAALQEANLEQETSYGLDSFSQEATDLIKKIIHQPQAAVHFVSNGTQANYVSLSSLLKPYEAVLAANTGHIAVHEAGAVESRGHKIVTLPTADGKLTPQAIHEVLATHSDEHMVSPRVVYISHSTELGTIYKKQELQALHQLCQEENLYLFIDGARMGHALMSEAADATLQEIASYADLFTIGGTKNGAFLGEAIVITKPALQENFRYHLKQQGALLAKGRFLGIQFREFFKKAGTLYFENAKHANTMGQKLARGIESLDYTLLHPTETNQIFPIFPNALIKELQKKYGFYSWCKAPHSDESSVIRLVTSWTTPETAVQNFLSDLASIKS